MDESGQANRMSFSRRTLMASLTGVASLTAISQTSATPAVPNLYLPSTAKPTDGPIPEKFWRDVRNAFDLKPGLIHLNSANFAPSSRAVLERERMISNDISRDPSFENRLKLESLIEDTRNALATYLGVDADEVAITRNTSEGNRTVIDGINFEPGDEIIIWDQNHESNSDAWDVWAQRKDLKIIRVATPMAASNKEELITPFESSISARTRMIAFSHVSNVTGQALPAKDLCALARKKQLLSLVDGAQTFGMMQLDLHDMGCDFFTGSAHKWLAGPHEVGVLYVAARNVERVWPSMVTHNWDKQKSAGARRFDCLGQRQEGRIIALKSALDLHQAIGMATVERRIRFLHKYLRLRIESAATLRHFITPRSADMNGGILMLEISSKDAWDVFGRLYNEFKISALALPSPTGTTLRFGPNIYTSLEELDMTAYAVSTMT